MLWKILFVNLLFIILMILSLFNNDSPLNRLQGHIATIGLTFSILVSILYYFGNNILNKISNFKNITNIQNILDEKTDFIDQTKHRISNLKNQALNIKNNILNR